MQNIFSPSTNDQSIYYLNQIFGSMGGLLTGNETLFSTMFKVFNTTILGVAIVIVVYVVIMSVLTSAAEGEFLGKKYHGLWTPLRMVLGVAALIPTPSGFSGLQIVMMWVIMQGIGAADTVWSAILSRVQVTGSAYGVAPPPEPINLLIDQGLKNLLKSTSCAQTTSIEDSRGIYSQPKDNVSFKGYYCTPQNGNCNGTTPFTKLNCPADSPTCSYSFGPQGWCGKLDYCNQEYACAGDQASSLGCTVCKAQTDYVTRSQGLVETMDKLGAIFARADYAYLYFYTFSSVDPDNKGQGWEEWIQKYCADKGISPCCVRNAAQPANLCTSNAPASAFPDPGIFKGDVSNEAISLVLAPYAVTLNNVSAMTTLMNAYKDGIRAAMAGNPNTTKPTNLAGMFQEADRTGWMFAGTYYYYIAKQNKANVTSVNPQFSVSGLDQNFSLYRNNYAAVETLLSTSVSPLPAAGGGTSDSGPSAGITPGTATSLPNDPALAPLANVLNGAGQDIMKSFMGTVSGTTGGGATIIDPISKVQGLGEQLLLAAEVLYPIALAIALVAAAALIVASGTILGTGVSAAWTIWNPINTFFVPIIFGVLAILVSLGGTLAVYVPLIPYVIFTVGVIGWFGSTIEAMVAAPILALGILSPSANHHEIFGKAEPGLMLLFSIFLRPTLMLFGLVAGMLLSGVGIGIINASFMTVMGFLTTDRVGSNGLPIPQYVDLLELIFFMVSYVLLVITVINKSFAMIHVIPTQVMRWIHGEAAQYGEGEVLQEMKGGISGAGGQVTGAGKGLVDTSGSTAKGAAKTRQEGAKLTGREHAKAGSKLKPKP